MSGYEVFASYYDALTADVDYAARADHLVMLFDRHGKNTHQVLDLACGSGSLIVQMLQRGYDMIGVDSSSEMLSVAREKAAYFDNQPLLLCQDMRQLDLYGTVDAAVCMLDSFNHLGSTVEVAEVLRRLGLFIRPDGLLIFDANTPRKHRVTLANNTFVLEQSGLYCVWRNQYVPSRCGVDMQIDFFVENGDGYIRETEWVRERAYTMSTWKRLLRDAGFDLLRVYGELSEDAPTEDADRWVFVTRNRAIYQQNGWE